MLTLLRWKENEFKKKCKCGHRKKMHVNGEDNYSGECCIIYRDKKGNLKSCYCLKFVEDEQEGTWAI